MHQRFGVRLHHRDIGTRLHPLALAHQLAHHQTGEGRYHSGHHGCCRGDGFCQGAVGWHRRCRRCGARCSAPIGQQCLVFADLCAGFVGIGQGLNFLELRVVHLLTGGGPLAAQLLHGVQALLLQGQLVLCQSQRFIQHGLADRQGFNVVTGSVSLGHHRRRQGG